jgi:hypothetical protein
MRFDAFEITRVMRELQLPWDHDYKSWEQEWTANLTRVIDVLTQWCKDSGITGHYSFGFTQIELCVTFQEKKDAMLFKLRWHNGARA